MTKDELIKELLQLAEEADYRTAHYEAEDLLLKYINDEDIEEAFSHLGKRYD